jgi:cell division protein FtsQ
VFGYIGWRAWKNDPASLASPAPSAPLRHITVRSDGVLDRAWVESTLRVPVGARLMDIDLAASRDLILRGGQVRNAVVARRLPDTLVVTLEERSPVLRLRARESGGAENVLYVARDGFVFQGDNFDDTLVASLPWLAGVTLGRDRSGVGFAPVVGMEAVSDLLGTVRSSAPSLARDFQIVSLARYALDGVILVKTPEVAEIAFGGAEGFYPQIARLDYILSELRTRPDPVPVRSINLAIGGRQVPVAFEPPAAPPATPARPAAPARVRPAAAPVPAATATPRPLFTL